MLHCVHVALFLVSVTLFLLHNKYKSLSGGGGGYLLKMLNFLGEVGLKKGKKFVIFW